MIKLYTVFINTETKSLRILRYPIQHQSLCTAGQAFNIEKSAGEPSLTTELRTNFGYKNTRFDISYVTHIHAL